MPSTSRHSRNSNNAISLWLAVTIALLLSHLHASYAYPSVTAAAAPPPPPTRPRVASAYSTPLLPGRGSMDRVLAAAAAPAAAVTTTTTAAAAAAAPARSSRQAYSPSVRQQLLTQIKAPHVTPLTTTERDVGASEETGTPSDVASSRAVKGLGKRLKAAACIFDTTTSLFQKVDKLPVW